MSKRETNVEVPLEDAYRKAELAIKESDEKNPYIMFVAGHRYIRFWSGEQQS